jgi:hypothetical protein
MTIGILSGITVKPISSIPVITMLFLRIKENEKIWRLTDLQWHNINFNTCANNLSLLRNIVGSPHRETGIRKLNDIIIL